ncbi:hypothetical protein B7486_52245 [cyanobacterium TDX16]|nr:hypothetical protein B7486_52245 [cyanobacterium TDX16]
MSLGYVAIALPGIFNGRRVMRDDWGKIWAESLIPELELFANACRRFYFCFDRDTKPKTVKNVNLAILKTGKLLEQKGCEIHVISLPGPEKGVDDFVVANGAIAFDAIYQQALPLGSWQWRVRKQAELTYTPWLQLDVKELTLLQLPFAPPQTTKVGQERLNLPDSPNGGIIVLASGKGTGKTKFISRLVQDAPKAIAAGHRIALMRNLCARMGLDYKGDVDRVNGDFITGSAYTLRLGLCVDSLLSIHPEKFAGCVLVIDEFMQVFSHLLTSSTCNKDGKRAALLARLHWLIRVASWVIVADADAADIGIDYLRSLRGAASPVYLIRNVYQASGYPVRFLDAARDDAIIGELLADIRAGLKIFVATDAKRGSLALKHLIETLEQEKTANLVLINSDTSGGESEVEFIRNINQRVLDVDTVIATPSMATGVSIEVEHFDKVYGLFYGTVTDADAAQALIRVRANIPRVVWCATVGKNFSKVSKSESPFQLKQALKTRWEAEISIVRTSLSPDLIPGVEAFDWDDNPHLDLWAKLTAKTNAAMWNLRANLLERLRYEGNTVEVVRQEKNSPVASAMADARSTVKQEYYNRVATAKLLNKSELATLERQEFISPEDQLAIEKTQIAEFYSIENVTPQLVAYDNGGKRRGQIVELEVLLTGAELSTKRDIDAIERQLKWGHGVLPFDHPCYELRRFARDALGLLPFLVPGREWTDAELEPLGKRARACSRQVRAFFGFSIPDDPLYANNVWIFRRLLEQLGIETKARRIGREQSRYVRIDADAWDELRSILSKRQAKRSALAATTPVALTDSFDVVTPPYINKSEGVTTGSSNPMPKQEPLTPQALQTGVELLGEIAQTEAVENLKNFTHWTPQQLRQLWQVVPSWVKEKIRSLIDSLQGRASTLLPHLDLP